MNIPQKIYLSLLALAVAFVPTTVFGANNFVLSADTNFAINTSTTGEATTVVGLNGGAVVSAVTGANYIDVTMESGSAITFKSPYGYTITGTVTSGSGVSNTFSCTSLSDSRLVLSASDSAVVRVEVTPVTAGCAGGGGGGVVTSDASDDSSTETEDTTDSGDSEDESTDQEDESSTSENSDTEMSQDQETGATTEDSTPTGVCYEAHPEDQIQRIICEAKVIIKDHVNELPMLNKYARSETKEAAALQFTNKLGSRFGSLGQQLQEKIRNFIVYGTPESKKLGEGERTGVVNSFQAAFGKLPQSETDWEDVIKIGAGRWPSQAHTTREDWAEARFRETYLRTPDRDNARDDAAVVIIAYGMRPNPRNVAAEVVAIQTFESIFNQAPTTAEDWDMVRAIAYSGAVR